jgi:hypothetical protein
MLMYNLMERVITEALVNAVNEGALCLFSIVFLGALYARGLKLKGSTVPTLKESEIVRYRILRS